MKDDDTLAKKVAESKRLREDNRQKLKDAEEIMSRITVKLDLAEQLRRDRKKRTDKVQ